MALWTLADQQRIKPIEGNNISTRFEQLRREVELNDIQKYLGFEFYQELLRNPSQYALLINGGSYTDNGYIYQFSGLKYVCAYLLYARYVRESAINDTFSGLVVHTTEGMQRISGGELQNISNRYAEIAGTTWDECQRYLCTLNLVWFPQKSKTNNKIDFL